MEESKMAKATTDQTYEYPIQDVYKVITESILKQMKGKGKKNNIVLKSPLGSTSDYTITKNNKERAIHFEVIAYEKPYNFSYIHTVDTTETITHWVLEDFSATTTKVTFTQESGRKSLWYSLFSLINRKAFHRTANGYFYSIDAVLEKEAQKKKKTTKKNKPDYTTMTVAQLKEVAKEKNINIPSKAKKADIIALVSK